MPSASAASSIEFFVVTDQPLVVAGFEHLAGCAKHYLKLAGSASSVEAALKTWGKTAPDVVILDLDIEEEDPVAAIGPLFEQFKACILALTASRDVKPQDRAVLLGARGVLHKRLPLDTMATAIRRVHEGQVWLDRAATGRIFVELSRKSSRESNDPERSKVSKLTTREKHIISVAASQAGANAKKIAHMLHITENTLRNHLTSIYAKLGVANRLELHSYAQKHDLLREERTTKGASK